MQNLASERLTASGVARGDSCHLTSIHGSCTTTGIVGIYNGLDATAPLVAEFSFPTGFVSVEEAPFSWRLDQGCYVEFTGFVGAVTLSFC